MAVAISNMGATWNTSPTAVNTAIKINVTDTSSQGNSKLLDLQLNGVSRFNVDKKGNLVLGSNNWGNSVYNYKTAITVNGSDTSPGGFDVGINGWYNSITAPSINFIKSRGTSSGTHTVVQDGDNLMWIVATGANGSTSYDRESAAISAYADGAPSGNSVPGGLAFWTAASGDQYVTARMRITSDGFIGIGTYPFAGTTSFVNYKDPVITEDGGYFGGGAYYDNGWRTTVANQSGWAIRNSSGVFTIYTGTTGGASGNVMPTMTERVRVDSSGRFTIPYQPSFSVSHSNNTMTTGTIIWTNVNYNIGSHYSTSTGRFTAPVAGIYAFMAHTLTAFASVGDTRIAIQKNAATINGSDSIIYKASNTWVTSRSQAIVQLAAGDYVTAAMTSSPGVLYNDPNYNQFSGYLLG